MTTGPTPPAPPAMLPNPVLKWVRTNLVERTLKQLPRTADVLDLCCGYGFYFDINPRARGVDGDPVSVAHLQARGFDIVLSDVLLGLPYGDGTFEHVVAHDVMEHFTLEESSVIMREVHRILKPGGRFWVFVPNRKGFDYGVALDIGHKHYVTAADVETLRNGLFELERAYPEPLPRMLGDHFTHNKEVFVLQRPDQR